MRLKSAYYQVCIKRAVSIAEPSRAQRSTMGKKICLSRLPRNFGSEKVALTRTYLYVRTYIHPFMYAGVKFCF